jgi:hypothetical protein
MIHVEIHASARRHGIAGTDVDHAVSNAIVIVDLDRDADPPRVLCIGPDHAGNLLEVIWIELAGERALAIHAMRLRPAFFGLLPEVEEES